MIDKDKPLWQMTAEEFMNLLQEGLSQQGIASPTTSLCSDEELKALIKAYRLEEALTDLTSIKNSSQTLTSYLKDSYGEAINQYYELSFKQEKKGNLITGSIDVLWETDKGVVLIDFKTYSRKVADVLNKENSHYAGLYAGQLNTYAQVIEDNGLKLIDKLIYYPVLYAIVSIS